MASSVPLQHTDSWHDVNTITMCASYGVRITILYCTLSGRVSATERSIAIAEFQVGHLNLSGAGRIQYLAQNFLSNPFYNSGSEKDPPPCQDVPHQHQDIQLARDGVYLPTLTCDWAAQVHGIVGSRQSQILCQSWQLWLSRSQNRSPISPRWNAASRVRGLIDC